MGDEITRELFRLQDTAYRDFQLKLIPTVDPASVIGVRTPELRAMAKRLLRSGQAEAFLRDAGITMLYDQWCTAGPIRLAGRLDPAGFPRAQRRHVERSAPV